MNNKNTGINVLSISLSTLANEINKPAIQELKYIIK